MKTLLLNKNPVISKLVRMSAQKVEYEFEERSAYSGDIGEFDIIIVDDGVNADLNELKAKCKTLICISSGASASEDGKQILHKPFLPTDLISLMRNDELLSEANAENSATAAASGEQNAENADLATNSAAESAADEDEIDLDSLSFDSKLFEPENTDGGAVENAENLAAADGGATNSAAENSAAAENGAENLENLAETAADSAANLAADTATANSADENNIYLQDITGESAENSASASENAAQSAENSAEPKDELAFTPVDFDTKLDFDFNSLAPSGETALNSDIADKILANIESENLGLSGESAEASTSLNGESAASESVLNSETAGEKSSQITLDNDETASAGGESQIKLDENQELAIGNESQIALDGEISQDSNKANADDSQLSSNESGANDDDKALTGDEPLEFDAQDLAEITEGLDLEDFNAGEKGEQENAAKKGTLSDEELAKATFLQPLNEPINEEVSAEKAEIQGENLENEAENVENLSENLENAENLAEISQNEIENTENLSDNLENESANPQNLAPETSETMENSNTETNEPAFSVEEKEEGKMSFDDLPENASFLGQKNSENIDPQDIKPVLVDEKPMPQSTQDLVKEQLADLNAMDEEFEQSTENSALSSIESGENAEISSENASQTASNAENQGENESQTATNTENLSEIPQNEQISSEIQGENAEISSENLENEVANAEISAQNELEIPQSQTTPNTENQSENASQTAPSFENQGGENTEIPSEIPQNEPQISQIPSQTAPNAEILDDLQGLNENEIQIALGEAVSPKAEQKDIAEQENAPKSQNTTSTELVSGLDSGISGAITITNNMLKEALKGMKMHIDISVKFDEDKA